MPQKAKAIVVKKEREAELKALQNLPISGCVFSTKTLEISQNSAHPRRFLGVFHLADTHWFLGILHLTDTQVLQGNDATRLLIL